MGVQGLRGLCELLAVDAHGRGEPPGPELDYRVVAVLELVVDLLPLSFLFVTSFNVPIRVIIQQNIGASLPWYRAFTQRERSLRSVLFVILNFKIYEMRMRVAGRCWSCTIVDPKNLPVFAL